eukprot:538685-Amorphochlora_amoeboformis.AAC.1
MHEIPHPQRVQPRLTFAKNNVRKRGRAKLSSPATQNPFKRIRRVDGHDQDPSYGPVTEWELILTESSLRKVAYDVPKVFQALERPTASILRMTRDLHSKNPEDESDSESGDGFPLQRISLNRNSSTDRLSGIEELCDSFACKIKFTRDISQTRPNTVRPIAVRATSTSTKRFQERFIKRP